jgi:hypothetical protein
LDPFVALLNFVEAFSGERSGLRPIQGVDLTEQSFHERAYRIWTQPETLCNLLVRIALFNQQEHIDKARAQIEAPSEDFVRRHGFLEKEKLLIAILAATNRDD